MGTEIAACFSKLSSWLAQGRCASRVAGGDLAGASQRWFRLRTSACLGRLLSFADCEICIARWQVCARERVWLADLSGRFRLSGLNSLNLGGSASPSSAQDTSLCDSPDVPLKLVTSPSSRGEGSQEGGHTLLRRPPAPPPSPVPNLSVNMKREVSTGNADGAPGAPRPRLARLLSRTLTYTLRGAQSAGSPGRGAGTLRARAGGDTQ